MSTKKTILAAVDLAETTESILSTAFGLADRSTRSITVVHVADPLSAEGWMNSDDARRTTEEMRSRTQRALDGYVESHPGSEITRVEVVLGVGKPARKIIDLAGQIDADSIVMGSHSRRGIDRLLLGSVAERVVRLAGCSVIVVREKHHDPALKVPEIEPLCSACDQRRRATDGSELWCARHSEGHIRAHVYSSAGRTESPSAWSSMTGE